MKWKYVCLVCESIRNPKYPGWKSSSKKVLANHHWKYHTSKTGTSEE